MLCIRTLFLNLNNFKRHQCQNIIARRNVPIVSTKSNNSSSSSCLNVLYIALILIFTPIFLYVRCEDSIKPYFYYHFSSNGIRYGIPKIGKKEAIITGVTAGTQAIDIPNFVSYKDAIYPVTTIDKKAFNSCTSLTSVIVGDSVRSIYCDFFCNSFCYCPNLRYLKVKSGNPVYYSPDRCDAIIQKSSIGGKNYNNLIVGCGNTIVPEDVTSIGEYAFSGRVNMTSITIPSSVRGIYRGAFNQCTSLTSVVIPDSVRYINEYTFYRCKNLASVVIPESVTSIRYMAFYECNSLMDVYCYAKEPPSFWIPRSFYHQSPFDETFIKEHTTLHVPASSIERYRREAPWSRFKSIVAIE